MSHELWSGGKTLDERLARLAAFENEYPGALRHVGLVSPSGGVVSSAKLYSCSIAIKGTVIPLVGLGAVFTDPEYRNRGYAAQMIRQCISEAEHDAKGGVMLWSDIGAPYYEKLGFVRLPLVRQRYAVASTGQDFLMRFATSKDRSKMTNLFGRQISPLIVTCLRPLEVWDFYRQLNGAKDYIVEDPSGRFAGYFSAAAYGDYLWVDEALAEPQGGERVWSAIVKLAIDSNVKNIQSWCQPFGVLPIPEMMVQVQKPLPMIRLFKQSLPSHLKPTTSFFGSLDHY